MKPHGPRIRHEHLNPHGRRGFAENNVTIGFAKGEWKIAQVPTNQDSRCGLAVGGTCPDRGWEKIKMFFNKTD